MALICSVWLSPSTALADFPPVTNFPNTGFHQARALGDQRGVALIELTGNYDRDSTAGAPNVEPRTVVAKEFFRTHPDHYDFIVVFSTFEFDTKDATAFHLGVQNKIKGLGLAEYDSSAFFGSFGKLQGYIDMAALGRYAGNPTDPKFDTVLQVFAHEFLHQWAAKVHFRGQDGRASDALLGKDGAHWSFLLDSGASVEYGNQWRDNGDGSFTSVAGRQFYSPLDLYLMGLYRKEEVPPFYLIENPAIDKTRLPENGVTINGVRKTVSIDDVIAIEGARSPDVDHAQKEFRLGFVLLSRAGAAPTDDQITMVNDIRKAISTRIEILSGGRALAHTYLETKAADSGNQTPGPTPERNKVLDLVDGMNWLRKSQNVGGYWQDSPFTAVRDSVVAFDTLADLDPGFTGRTSALNWLQAQNDSNADYLARRLRTLGRSGIDIKSYATQLLAQRNTDGGWGVALGYQSNSLDTALVIQALRPLESSLGQNSLDSAVDFLLTRQNPDGGWGNLTGGSSRLAVSAAVVQALVGRAQAGAWLSKANAFLAGRQHADGGFGDSDSTVHDTANVVLTLLAQNSLGLIRSADATTYIASAQRTDGSWDGSAYSSALALRLLKSAGLFNWSLTDLKARPTGPQDGQPTVLSFKVSNAGTSNAPAGIVRVYDGDPAAAGVPIGADINVPALLVGDSIELKLLWNTFDKAGPHTLVAVIDPDNQVQEASKQDNRAQLQLVVAAAPTQAELLVTAADIVVNPAHPNRLPTVLAISAQIANIGKTNATAVRVVLRAGEGGSGKIIDEKIINMLGRTRQVVNFSAVLNQVGSVSYTVQIDPDNQVVEPDKANNLASVQVETTSSLDLEVRDNDLAITRTPVYIGADAIFKVKLHNSGTRDAPLFKVRYSVGNGSQNVEVATRSLQLAAGASVDQDVVWRSEISGNLAFKVELDPDNVLIESDKANNVANLPFEVLAASGTNLALSFKDFVINPLPAREGQAVTLSQTVRNTGNVAASNVEVGFYDGDPAGGKLIGALQTILNLAPGAAATVSVIWPRYPDGDDHLLFAVVDPANKQSEITRDDNSAFVVINALTLPDLAIDNGDLHLTPAAPKPGDALTLSAKISNLGKQDVSNVLVRLYDADPANGGKPIAPDQTVTVLAAGASQTQVFNLPASNGSGVGKLVVVLDPDNQIHEKTRANNLASVDLQIQDGNFYISNRYFSPNGDGIKDDTTFAFRLQTPVDVTVEVVNSANKVVRSFTGDNFKGVQSGNVSWDGLNQRGSVVPDGDYRLRVSAVGGGVLGDVRVTLDTNRSSVLTAIDTPYEQITNLSCEAKLDEWPRQLRFSADEERFFAYNQLVPDIFPEGTYRGSVGGGDLRALLSADLLAQGGWQAKFASSKNGEKVALIQYYYPAPEMVSTRLWIIDGDGRNAKIVREWPYFVVWGFPTFAISSSGDAVFIIAKNKLLKFPVAGVSAETVLYEWPSSVSSISEKSRSPDGNVLLLYGYDDTGSKHYIANLQTGRVASLPDNFPVRSLESPIEWSPDSKTFAFPISLGQSDFEINVIDLEFNIVRTFKTSEPSEGANSLFYASIGNISWASDSNEFVFSHSYCEWRSCPVEYCPPPVDNGKIHSQTLYRADKGSGTLELIKSATLPLPNYCGGEVDYRWAPGERMLIRTNPECMYNQYRKPGQTCSEVIDLDNDARIRPVFKNWYSKPSLPDNAYANSLMVNGFLPSGRKLMLQSSRDAVDSASSCYGTGPDQYILGSLLNLTADFQGLRGTTVGGLVLRGTATDLNFAGYRIEYAASNAPADWKVVVPTSTVPVVDNVFTNWVPPTYGNYLLRLTVEDLAGNTRQQIRRVVWSDTPAITDVYKDNEFISPNGDGVQEEIKLHYRVLEPVHLEFNVLNKDGLVVRSLARDHSSIGVETFFVWDGRNQHGQLVPDGQYKVTVQNYEFYVTVDNLAPSAAIALHDAYGFIKVDGIKYVNFSTALTWQSDDVNYDKMLIEHGVGALPQYWEEFWRYPNAPKADHLSFDSDISPDVQCRITVTDKAGNQTKLATGMVKQQVFFLRYANHRLIYPPAPTDPSQPPNKPYWAGPLGLEYRQADIVAELPGFSHPGGNPLRLEVVETVRKPLTKVILQYREVTPADRQLPLGRLNELQWEEILLNNFVKYSDNKTGIAGEGMPTSIRNGGFELVWDLQNIKVGTEYMVRLKVVDQDNSELFAETPYLFKTENFVGIKTLNYVDAPLRKLGIEVNGLVYWNEPVTKVDLLLSSKEDPRFLAGRVVDTVFNPQLSYPHNLSAEQVEQLGLHFCTQYLAQLKVTTRSGAEVYSPLEKLPPRCLDVDWRVVPDTAQVCNAVPTSKLRVKLIPYSMAQRRLTQLLFGLRTTDGHEEVLNNWNDVKANQAYDMVIDSAQLVDGKRDYFARVVDEDGKVQTVSVPIEIGHQPISARITVPLAGQKLCGIKARNPYDLAQMINVVPIEGAISSDTSVSYGLEYGNGTDPNSWTTFAPAGILKLRDGFVGLRQAKSHLSLEDSNNYDKLDFFVCPYPDAKLCDDFHPIQWASYIHDLNVGQYELRQGENFPGQAASNGHLGTLGLLEQIEGPVSVRLRVFNAAGYQSCSEPVSFEFDNKVRVLSTALDRALFSNKAEGVANSVKLSMVPDEVVTVDVEVLHASLVNKGKLVLSGAPVRILAHQQLLPGGETVLEWDGLGDGNGTLADGLYGLRITYTDNCGNVLVEEKAVELDNTPPDVRLSSPSRDARLGLIVPVVGAIRDPHLQAYAVQYALPASPDTWIPLFAGDHATLGSTDEETLGNWNTLGLSGPLTLRVLARDLAGNQTALLLPLEVGVRSDLISYLEAAPDPFSPNGDQKRDTVSLRYGLLAPAKATLEIWRTAANPNNPTLVKTLINNETVPAGAAIKQWDGKNNAGQLETDGALLAKLSVTATGDIAARQEVSAQFALDNTPPQLAITYPLRDIVTAKGAFSITASDLHLDNYKTYFASNPASANNANWQLQSQGTQSTSGPTQVLTLEGLADGKYGAKLVAQDTAENAAEVVKLFEIDNTPPKVSFSAPLADSYLSAKKGLVNIVAAIEEKNLDKYQLRYALGRDISTSNFVELANGSSLPLPAILKAWDVAAVPDGAYTMWLSADDLAGQNGTAKLSLVVDNTPPLAQITNPANGANVTNYVTKAMDISGTASDVNLKQYTLEVAPGTKATANRWSLVGSANVEVKEGVLFKWQALPPDGAVTLRLTVTDKAGNVSEAFTETVIDTKPPQAPLNLVGKLENRKDARLSWTANTEPDLAGYALYRNGVRLNTVLLQDPAYLDAGLATGNYEYQVKALDKAGLESAVSNSVSLTVSINGPVAQIFSPARAALISGLIDVKGSASAGSDFKEYRLFVGAGATPGTWQLLRRSPVPIVADVVGNWNTLGLPENSVHTIKLESEDLFGSIATDSVSVTVDNTPPNAPTVLKAVPNGNNVTLSWTPSTSPDLAGYVLYRNQRVANAQGTVVGSLKPYLIVPPNYLDIKVPDGSHTYQVQAMDKAENLSEPSNTVTVVIDTRAPQATIIKPLNGAKVGGIISILATSPDTDIAKVQFQFKPASGGTWTNIGAAVTQLPWTVNWNPAGLAFGDYLLQAIATDLTNHTDPAPVAIMVSYGDLQAPDRIIDLKGQVNGGDVTLTWSNAASDLANYLLDRIDPDGVVLTRSVAATQPASFVDPDLPDARYTYRVVAIDSANNKSVVSNEVSLLVYTPTLVQPYTPSSQSSFALKGSAQANGKLTLLSSETPDPVTRIEIDPNPDGSFALASVPVRLGDNRFGVSQRDADGNISKSARFHVLRADPPAVPTGLHATTDAGVTTLSWVANGEANLLGYRVLVNQQDDAQSAIPDAADASSYNTAINARPELAIDGNSVTGWMPDIGQELVPQWLSLHYPQAQTFFKAKVSFGRIGVARDYDIEGWDGEVWVTLATVRGNTAEQVETVFAQPYRTDRIRLKFIGDGLPNVAEIVLFKRPYQIELQSRVPDLVDTVTFKVAAENTYGMFSEAAQLQYDTGVKGQADLAVLDSDIEVGPVKAGVATGIRVQVRNSGQAAANNFAVSISATDASNITTLLTRQTLDTLAAGAQRLILANWTAAAAGEYVISVTADPDGVVNESNENNNQARKPVLVLVPPPALNVPVILGPTTSDKPITVTTSPANIIGYASPGANVSLLRNVNGNVQALAQGVAVASVQSTDINIPSDSNVFHVSDDGSRLVTGGAVLTWIDLETGQSTVIPGVSNVTAVQWAHHGRTLALIQNNADNGRKMLYRYNIDDRILTQSSDLSISQNGLAWSADDSLIALIGYSGSVQQGVWLVDQHGEKRLLVNAPYWEFDSQLAWSPDGQYLAFARNDTVQVVKVADGSVIFTDLTDGSGGSYSYARSWSADGTRLIYEFYDDNGSTYRIGEYVLSDASYRALSPVGIDRQLPLWLGPDLGYVDDESNRLVWRNHDGSIKETLVYYPYSTFLTTPSGELFYRRTSTTISRVDPSGTFRFPRTALNPGVNDFAVRASDGNSQSATSQPIRITFDNAALADLLATEADIVLLPNTPLVSEATRLTASVRNPGRRAASNVEAVLTVRDPSGAVSTLERRTIALLAAGDATPITLDWTPARSGQYTFVLTLDPADSIQEVSEANNVGVRVIEVANAALPTLTLTTGARYYNANTPVDGSIRLANAGPQLFGSLLVRVEDKDGYLVESLPSISVNGLGYGQNALYPLNWNSGTTLAGEYRFSATLQDVNGTPVTNANAPFGINAAGQVTAALLADRTQYRAGQTVNLSATIRLQAANASLNDASAVIKIVNAKNDVVFETPRSLGNLLPGAVVNLTVPWNVGNNGPDRYRAKIAVSAGGPVLANDEVAFDIVQDSLAQVTGSFTLSSATIANGDNLSVNYQLKNTGNVVLNAMPLTLKVLDPDTQAELAVLRKVIDLEVGAQLSLSGNFTALEWPLKSLTVVMAVDIGGKSVVLQRSPLRVIDRLPPVVGFVTPAAGAIITGQTPVVVKAIDRESQVASVEYSLPGVAWKPIGVQSQLDGLYAVRLVGVADGPYPIQARASDSFNNVAEPVTLNVVIDNTPPSITVNGVANGNVYSTDVAANITVTDVNLGVVQIQLDGVAYVSGASINRPGPHELQINAQDKAGNSAAKTIQFQIVFPAPTVSITAPATGNLLRTPFTVSGTAASSALVISKVEVQIDGGNWNEAGALAGTPGQYQYNVATLPDGAHQLLMRATDSQAQATTSVPVDVVIDNTAPLIGVTGVSNGGSYSTPVTPVISITDAHKVSSTVTLDGVAWVPNQTIASPGVHVLQINAKDELGNQSSLTISFTIVDTRIELTGALAATPASVEVGANVIFTETVLNHATALKAVHVQLTVINTANNAVVLQEENVIDLAAGANWHLERSWPVVGPAGTNYAAKLVATVGDKSFLLGEAKFVAIANKPQLTLEYGPAYPQRILVYSQCKRSDSANRGHCGAKPLVFDNPVTMSRCDADRANAIHSFLNGLAVNHTVVTNATDLASALQTGGYSGYWISGGATKLPQPLPGQLKEGLRLGESLLVDGMHDLRLSDRTLHDLLSVRYRGQFAPGKAPKMVTLGKLFPADEFQVLGDVLVTDPGPGGVAQARLGDVGHLINYDIDQDGVCGNASGHGNDPSSGIISGQYAPGHTLYFAFDWMNTLSSQSADLRWRGIGRNSFDWLQAVGDGSDESVIAGDIVTRKIHLHNAGADVDLSVMLELSADLKALAVNPSAPIQTRPGGDSVTWPIKLPAGAGRDLTVQLKLPQTDGKYRLRYTINSIANGQASLYGIDDINIEVQAVPALLANAFARVNELSVSGPDNLAAKAEVVRLLTRVQQMSGLARIAAVRELVLAQSRLDRISGVDLTAAQRALARLQRGLERHQ
jgi:subtilase family serine protease/flagellar hook assembly protein FlgD